jgi:uncharacterized protein YlxP (DUF503 family)
MWIAASRLVLDDYGNEELKRKRRELKALIETVRKEFNVSLLEVAEFSDTERGVLGLTLVAGTERGAREAVAKVLARIDALAFARVVSEETDVSEF